MDRPWSGGAPDRGQAIPVLIVLVGVIAAVVVGVAAYGAHLVAGERAATAADAAALAGAVHGRQVAARIAAANGAEMVGWELARDPHGRWSTVVVTVTAASPIGTVAATARAQSAP